MLYRKSLTSAVFQDEKTWKVWSWCVLRANWQTIPIDFDGKELTLKRGEFLTGTFSMIGELGMSKSTIWRHLKKLENWGNIGIETGNRGTIISVINFDVYQDPTRSEFVDDGNVMGMHRESSGNPAGIQREQIRSKESKEEKEVKTEVRPDTLITVVDFFASNNASQNDAADFWDHFESNGWRVGGKSPMKDWHAAARKWIRNNIKWGNNGTGQRTGNSQGGRERHTFTQADIAASIVPPSPARR